jgi:capsular exopolysaccharide synthesis family protein
VVRLGESRNGARPPNVIAFTSCYPGEGVSTVASNLALTSAHHGRGRVVLVDANFRRPSVHRVFGASLSPGMADVGRHPLDPRALVQPSSVANLHLVCAGSSEVDLPQVYHSKEFYNLLGSLRRECSLVLFDTPALSEAGSTHCLASRVDGMVLVLEAERVRWQAAERAKQQLVEAGANLLGVILNKRQLPIPRWLYRTL